GFTMSIFIAELAYAGQPQYLLLAKTGIIAASLIAGIAGMSWLSLLGSVLRGRQRWQRQAEPGAWLPVEGQGRAESRDACDRHARRQRRQRRHTGARQQQCIHAQVSGSAHGCQRIGAGQLIDAARVPRAGDGDLALAGDLEPPAPPPGDGSAEQP